MIRKIIFNKKRLKVLIFAFIFACTQAMEESDSSLESDYSDEEPRLLITVHNDTWDQRTKLEGTVDYKDGTCENFGGLIEGITKDCSRITCNFSVQKKLTKSVFLFLRCDDQQQTGLVEFLLDLKPLNSLLGVTFTTNDQKFTYEALYSLPPLFHERGDLQFPR